jgi:hypothetical protein
MLHAVAHLFYQSLQKKFWARTMYNIAREQLGRWAAGRALPDRIARDNQRHRFNIAIRNEPDPRNPSPELLERLKAEEEALPDVAKETSQMCAPGNLALQKLVRTFVATQLPCGERQAAMVSRFGPGVLCLPMLWDGVK